jgi:glutamyl-Q tRNA(Asp) synthetase
MPPLDLVALRDRLPDSPITRFAPSPTGFLHLGHVANAIYVWGIARALGGRVLIRIEDHDRGRSRPGYERALLDDLEWLGLVPDLGNRASPNRQSDSGETYQTFLAGLAARSTIYACDCSRKDIAAEGGDRFNQETRYSGRCRSKGLPAGPSAGIRVVLEPGEERFEDALAGPLIQVPADQCGDLLLRDRNGNWTYQFAVVVDDLRHGVDLVIRGEDLLASTGRQIRLARMLGRERAPVFLHHPLIRKPDGTKLSKSSGDSGIAELRAAGATPEEVLGTAAWRTGLIPSPRGIAVGDLATLF